MSQTIVISLADIPESYCPESFRESFAHGVQFLRAELPGGQQLFNYGPTTPTPDNQDKPWFKTDANLVPERWYTYSAGAWVSRHPTFAGQVIMWEGEEGDIPTLDGGEAGVVSDRTGPMWEKVSALDARIPCGPGTFASGRTLSVTGTLGEEKHELTRAELPEVTIDTALKRRVDLQDGGGSTALYEPSFGGGVSVDVPTEELGDGEAHENLPPVYGIWFLRKTGRTLYRI